MMQSLRNKMKFALLDRWRMPFSPVPGLAPSLFRRFRFSTPISVVDVGAHQGHFTMAVDAHCGVKEAILVEPIAELAGQMRADPLLKRARVEECAISVIDGEIEMKIFPDAPEMSSALDLESSIEGLAQRAKTKAVIVKRPARRLDTIAMGFAVDGIDLIKIDVQGLEHLVIKSGLETLKRTRAVFTEVSFRPLYQGSSLFSDVMQLMREQEFSLVDLEPGFKNKSGELLQADALFVRLSDSDGRSGK